MRRWDRLPENRTQGYRYRTGAEFRQYQDRIDQKGRHDCYRFFDGPLGIECLAGLQKILDNAPTAECCVHHFVELKAFIFRDGGRFTAGITQILMIFDAARQQETIHLLRLRRSRLTRISLESIQEFTPNKIRRVFDRREQEATAL